MLIRNVTGRHSSISSLHATIIYHEDASTGAGAFQLLDSGSAAGSSVCPPSLKLPRLFMFGGLDMKKLEMECRHGHLVNHDHRVALIMTRDEMVYYHL